MAFMVNDKEETDHLSADLYLQTKGGNLKNVPATFDPTVLLAGCFFALVALFLALASQRERRASHKAGHGSNDWKMSSHGGAYPSPNTARKVQWQLGSYGSSEDDDEVSAMMYINHGKLARGHKKNAPSYDGMYWSADPE